jgi:valyl-tRNA synthetase
MADAIYHFVWGTFCDWYVELIKGAFDEETKAVAAWAFDQILVMLHPLMPFITEELWNAMGERPYELIVARWPEPNAFFEEDVSKQAAAAIELIEEIRRVRNELGIGFSEVLPLHIHRQSPTAKTALYDFQKAIIRMARVSFYVTEAEGIRPPPSLEDAAPSVAAALDLRWVAVETNDVSARLKLPESFDIQAEKSRLARGAEAAEKERDSLAQRLANPNFTERAKPEAVEKARADHEAKAAEAERLRAALERLG